MNTELTDPPETRSGGWKRYLPLLADLTAVLAGAWLVWWAAVVGQRLLDRGVNLFLDFPPLFASWAPHTGPGTVPAIVVAIAVVAAGPRLSSRMRWGPLLLTTYLASFAWIFSLTLIDTWKWGVWNKLRGPQNYLYEIKRVESIPALLEGFTSRILLEPGSWAVHVAGHPPGALMVFVWLERIGLGGFVAGAFVCMTVGALVAPAIGVTLRGIGEEHVARKVLPFAVLVPAAVWIGVSADGLFAGVVASGVALVALGVSRRGLAGDAFALAGGLVLGFALYLSYGFVLAGLFPLVVLALGRRLRPAIVSAAGVAIVVALFTIGGFWWWEGYQLVKIRYYQGIASTRPYSYFVWANLACVVVATGPAVLAGLRRLAWAPRRLAIGARLLTISALIAIGVADLSGLSKAEVERIWLPFMVWLVIPCAMLPRKYVPWWLAAQAILALLVNHLLRTRW